MINNVRDTYGVVVVGGGAAGLSRAAVVNAAARRASAAAAINADLVAEETRRAVSAYRAQRSAAFERASGRAA